MRFWNIALFFVTIVASARPLNLRDDLQTVNKILQPICKDWQTIPMTENYFVKAYDGFGQIDFNKGLTLQPRAVASASPQSTHAALALLNDGKLHKNFAIRLQYKNEKALRQPAANTWEVFWLFFNYQAGIAAKKNSANATSESSELTKQTNYFIFKPNGVELGKAWGSVDQEFLKTSNQPRAQFGKDYELLLIKQNQHVRAYIDNTLALNFEATSNKTLFESPGQIGLYTEDAQVRIHKLEICDLPH